MTKPALRIVPPTIEIRKVTPRRPRNDTVRTREYLTEGEVEALIAACKDNRRPHRDLRTRPNREEVDNGLLKDRRVGRDSPARAMWLIFSAAERGTTSNGRSR